MSGHADVDDVVQETPLRTERDLKGLRSPHDVALVELWWQEAAGLLSRCELAEAACPSVS